MKTTCLHDPETDHPCLAREANNWLLQCSAVHTLLPEPRVLSRALAMALALGLMMATDSVHPPGGALIFMASDSGVIQASVGRAVGFYELTKCSCLVS